MKKLITLLLLINSVATIGAQSFRGWPLDELIIIEGIISFLDETHPIIDIGEHVINLEIPTDAWPGGLKEGDNVRIQGQFTRGNYGILEVSSIELILTPRRGSPPPPPAAVAPRPSEPRRNSPVENAASAAANSATAVQAGEDDDNTKIDP